VVDGMRSGQQRPVPKAVRAVLARGRRNNNDSHLKIHTHHAYPIPPTTPSLRTLCLHEPSSSSPSSTRRSTRIRGAFAQGPDPSCAVFVSGPGSPSWSPSRCPCTNNSRIRRRCESHYRRKRRPQTRTYQALGSRSRRRLELQRQSLGLLVRYHSFETEGRQRKSWNNSFSPLRTKPARSYHTIFTHPSTCTYELTAYYGILRLSADGFLFTSFHKTTNDLPSGRTPKHTQPLR
jgi:hypothetical protein